MVLFIIAKPRQFDPLGSQKEIFIHLMQGFFGANITGSGGCHVQSPNLHSKNGLRRDILNKWQIKVADLVDTFVEETLELISLEVEQPIAIGLAYRLAQHHIFVQGLQGFVQTRWNVAPLPHIFQPI